jgi:hypothetical protein
MTTSLSAATTWACAACRERFRPSGPRAGRVRRVGRSPDGAFHFSSLTGDYDVIRRYATVKRSAPATQRQPTRGPQQP